MLCLGLVACLVPALVTPLSQVGSMRQPGEFEPQRAVWLSADPDDSGFMKVTSDLIKTLRPHVPIKMLLESPDVVGRVKLSLKQLGVSTAAIKFYTDKQVRFFLRDATVFTVDSRRNLGIIDLKWSLYGFEAKMNELYPDDPKTRSKFLAYLDPKDDGLDAYLARVTGAKVTKSPLLLENATFEVNGKGVLLISQKLAMSRHPKMSRLDIEHELLKMPGIKKVIWLDKGMAEDPHMMATIRGDYVGEGAGGHTDEFVRFADAHTIMLAWVDDKSPSHPVDQINRERMVKNFEILSEATDQDGHPFRIIKVPTPKPIERLVTLRPTSDLKALWYEGLFLANEGRMAGDKLIQVAAASYLNFVIANDVVAVPSFLGDGTSKEKEAKVNQIFRSAFPMRKIVFVRATPLTWHGGGLHCATLNEPQSKG